MLSAEEFLRWIQRVALPEAARATVEAIRAAKPARLVGGGGRNVIGRYPSRKMGVTVQFESNHVERAFLLEYEHDPDVLEYYDQPPSIPLRFRGVRGKQIAVQHTPDFFVIRGTAAGWEECKREDELAKIAESGSLRYCKSADQSWTCPPGQTFADTLGLYYRVRSSSEVDDTLVRNFDFLDDYYRGKSQTVDPRTREAVRQTVAAEPVLTLQDLSEKTAGSATLDDLHFLIASGDLYVDLRAAPLVEPARVRVFANAQIGSAFTPIPHQQRETPAITLRSGTALLWDDKQWKILNVGTNLVALLGQDCTVIEVPVTAMEKLIRQRRVNVPEVSQASTRQGENSTRMLAAATSEDLETASIRVRLVRSHLDGSLGDHSGVSARALRLWVQRYKAAEQACGDGFVGLLPQTRNRGNRTRRLPESTRTLMELSIGEDYETPKQKCRYECWAILKEKCTQECIPFPCYSTYCLAIRDRSVHTQTRKRLGPRAAYASKEFYWSLDRLTHRHGDRPFEIAHIDHTEVDVELVCAETGRLLLRPWWTVMTDAFSRRILAMALSFEPPSYRSCMNVLRDCAQRHGRLPQVLVVDCGPEFRSTYFESLLARFECTKKTRPPAQARFGSVCERLFGTANTQFFHNLRGNTQVTRNVRQVTKQNDPAQAATWTLVALFEHLCEYVFEVYDTIDHPALGESPRGAFVRGLAAGGARLHRMIIYDDDFVMATLPTTVKGCAKVSPGRGIKIHNLWYWSDSFRDPAVENASVPVRYDPFDVGTAYAYVRKQWAKCYSDQYLVLKGRSEKEIMLASAELIRRGKSSSRARFTVTASRLASFITATELEEVFLLQRLRERNQALVRGLHRGGASVAGEPVPEPNHDDVNLTHASETFETYGEF